MDKRHIEHGKNGRVVLFPLPLQGHITPMLQLANILYERGFSITIIHTHFNSPNASNYPTHFTFHPILYGFPEHEDATRDVVSFVVKLNSVCVKPFKECLRKMLRDETNIKYLITDAACYFSQSAADELNLTRIVLRTSSISSFLIFSSFPFLLDKGYLPKQDSRLDELIQEFPPLKVKDLPTINTHDTQEFYKLVDSMVRETKKSSGIIWNSFEELEKSALDTIQENFSIPSYPIGPFHKYSKASSSSLLAQDDSSISWLNKQSPKSVLYVSFGSIATMEKNEFTELAWGLANSLQHILWVVRPDSVYGSDELEILPNGFMEIVCDRIHIVKWAPQQEVLAHKSVGGFWTHNGWNSTLESICEGVPMICSPCFTDQMVNARYVTDVWRVGLGFETKMERQVVCETIKKLMIGSEGEEVRERIQALKEKVDLSLKKDGSSYGYLDSLVISISSL